MGLSAEGPSSLCVPERPLTTVWVRHAEAAQDKADEDPPLTALGRRQAMRLARRLDRMEFAHVYASGARRAVETAQAILRFHKGTPITVLKDLDEISRDHFIVVPPSFRPAPRDVVRKEREAVERFILRLRQEHRTGQTVLVVGHGNFIRTILPLLGGRFPLKSILLDLSHASVSVLDVWPTGSAVLRLANCVKHLLPGEST